MKKLISIILTLVMLSASCVSFAATGTPTAYTLDIVNINQTAVGSSKTTTVTVRNYGDTPVPYVTLVVAVKNKATGEVADISMDEETNVTGDVVLSATATLPNTTDYVYEAFVWDNLDNMIPIGNEKPQIPQNLEVVSVSNSSVTLSWDAAKDDAGVLTYNVFCGGVKVGSTTATTYTHYGLEEETTYSYSISAQDGAGEETEQTAAVTATTQYVASTKMSDLPVAWKTGGIPTTVTEAVGNGLTVYSVDNLTTNLTFTTSFAPDSYNAADNKNTYSICEITDDDGIEKICYASYEMDSGYGMLLQIPSDSPLRQASALTYVVTYLDNGTQPIDLRYRSTSGNKELTGAFTRTNSNKWVTDSVTVTDAAYDGVNYHLWFDKNKDNGAIYIADVKIVAGESYVPKVEVLDAPNNFAATAVTTDSVTIEWDAVTSVRGDSVFYNIYRDGALIEEGIEETTYTDTGLTTGTEYSYSVEAYTCADNKVKSDSLNVTPEAAPAPTGFKVKTGTVPTTSTVTLTWIDNGADKYNLYYKTGDDSGEGVEAYSLLDDVTGDECTVVGLDDGQKYSFKLTAYKDGEESDATSAVVVTTENIATVNMSELSAWATTGIPSDSATTLSDGLNIYKKVGSPVFAADFSDSTTTANSYGFIQKADSLSDTRWCYGSYNMNAYGLPIQIPSGSPLRNGSTLTYIVTYLDNGTNPIALRYRGASANIEISNAFSRSNSGKWVTNTVTVTNAGYGTNYHLWFDKNQSNGTIYISEVGIAANYVEKATAIGIE